LFVSNSNNSQGERITTKTISRLTKEGLRAIGIDDRTITAHSLRHTAATNLIRSGASLQDTQMMLRHADISMTMHYTAFINEEKRFERTGESILAELYTSAMAARQEKQTA
jgi:integrase/recombinase XerD